MAKHSKSRAEDEGWVCIKDACGEWWLCVLCAEELITRLMSPSISQTSREPPFSIALWTSGLGHSVGPSWALCGVLSSILGPYLLNARSTPSPVTTTDVPRPCPVFPGGMIAPGENPWVRGFHCKLIPEMKLIMFGRISFHLKTPPNSH